MDGEADQQEDVEGGGLHGGLEVGVQLQQWQSWRSLDTQHPASNSPLPGILGQFGEIETRAYSAETRRRLRNVPLE